MYIKVIIISYRDVFTQAFPFFKRRLFFRHILTLLNVLGLHLYNVLIVKEHISDNDDDISYYNFMQNIYAL